jgi:hypothetical protein
MSFKLANLTLRTAARLYQRDAMSRSNVARALSAARWLGRFGATLVPGLGRSRPADRSRPKGE